MNDLLEIFCIFPNANDIQKRISTSMSIASMSIEKNALFASIIDSNYHLAQISFQKFNFYEYSLYIFSHYGILD